MIIPKSFKLHGQKITVNFVPNLMYKHDAFGYAIYHENSIELQPSTIENPIPQEVLEETFIHEMIHHIIDHIGGKYREDLRSDEEFVDKFAKLLHQALTTQNGYLTYESSGQDNQRGGEHVTDRS